MSAPSRLASGALVIATAALVASAAGCKKDDPPAPPSAASAPASAPGAAPMNAGASASAGAGALPDACSLVTAEDVRRHSGFDVPPGSVKTVATKAKAGNQCDFKLGPDATVAVTLADANPKMEALIKQSLEGLYKSHAESLPGYGERAFFIDGARAHAPAGALVATKGRATLTVVVMASAAEIVKLRPAAMAVAKAALEKL